MVQGYRGKMDKIALQNAVEIQKAMKRAHTETFAFMKNLEKQAGTEIVPSAIKSIEAIAAMLVVINNTKK